jgi:PAS domain S-box-containing protein
VPPPDERRIRQRELEAALEETEQLTRGILAAVPAGVVHVGPDGSIRTANAEAMRLLGLSGDALAERGTQDFATATVWEDGTPCRVEDYPVTRAMVTGEPQPAVTIGLRRPDGELSWCLLRAVPVKDSTTGATTGAVVTFHDITDRKKTEDALRRSEAELKAIVNSAPSIIFTADREGRVTFVNRTAPNLARVVSPEAIIGRSVLSWLDERDHPMAREHLRRVLDEGAVIEFEVEGRDGVDPNLYSVRAGPIERDGAIWGVAAVVTVLTERRRAEAERVQLLEQLNEARRLEALGRLSGGIAHDFNNLLTVILGSVEMVLRKPHEPALAGRLEEIASAATRAANLTRQLLAFGRQQALELQAVDLGDVVSNISEMLRRLVGEHIELIIDRATDVAPVLADPVEMERVIINLAMNAQDAMPDGGILRLVTRNLLAEAGAMVGVPPGRYVALEVIDAGGGMDPGTRAHIFEPFFTTKTSGVGLGLATVHGIVRQSGGHIVVDSERGKGTRVSVLLPRVASRAAQVRSSSMPPPSSEGSETILLVEDEPLVRQVAQRVLESAGYQVVVAESSEAAVDIRDDLLGSVDLLLTDVVMPRVNGPAVAAVLTERRPALRVLFMSGHVKRTHRQLPAGAPFLAKPFDGATLTAKVRAVLDGPA